MCPECKTPMLIIEFDAIELDHCLQCLGTWLDHGELDLIADRAKGDVSGVVDALNRASAKSASDRRCPRCNRKMKTVALDAPAGLEIEVCGAGHGLWFDHGELLTLVQTHAAQTEGVAAYFSEVLRSELDAGKAP